MIEVIGMALAVLTAVAISYPLWQKSRRKVNFALNHQSEELLARKEQIYAAIRDIELDYRMGKLSEEDYAALREQYKNEAIQIMKKLDGMAAPVAAAPKSQTAPAQHARFCHQCGQGVAATDLFCSVCGARLA